jgi:hypothetical protein
MEKDMQVPAVTATSFESFEAAALDALRQIPAGPEGFRSGKIVEQEVSEGGVVGGPQYRITLVTTPPSS